MKYFLQPFEHQMEAIRRARGLSEYALFFEMGVGKTKTVIEILRERCQENKRLLRTLVLTPSATIFNWKDEVLKNSKINETDVVLLNHKTSKGKLKLFLQQCSLESDLSIPKIVVTNYESLQSVELTAALLDWKPEVLIADESHNLKNPTAIRSKITQRIAKLTKYRYLLTGSPLLKDVADLYGQFLVLDNGATFGKNFSLFRKKYMVDANQGFAGAAHYFPNWQTRPETYDELNTLIYRKAMRVLKSECLDLPPVIVQNVYVAMTAEQEKHYKEMSRDLCTFIQDQDAQGTPQAVTASMAAVKALRLQQIVSGYVKTEEGDEVEFKANPKAVACKELLSELCYNHKVIVWCSFANNYRVVGKICDDLGIKYVRITGEEDAQAKRKSELSFQTDPDVRVMVAHRRAGGVGINLTAASYSIVFSRNFSLGDELQSDARNHRSGSEIHSQIVKINLIAKGTTDEDVIEAISKKEDISKAVIDAVKNRRE